MIDREKLYLLYIKQQKPMHQIADELGVAIGTVYNYLNKYNIETRDQKETFTMKGRKQTEKVCQIISMTHKCKTVSDETKHKISESHKVGGVGHKKLRSDGYISVYFPDHPKSSKDGYIMEHILVMECLIGRHLNANECIHHINQIKNDNRKENLKLMTLSEHMSFHAKERWDKIKGEII